MTQDRAYSQGRDDGMLEAAREVSALLDVAGSGGELSRSLEAWAAATRAVAGGRADARKRSEEGGACVKTPAEHIANAGDILDALDLKLTRGAEGMSTADAIALAKAHTDLAAAKTMLPLGEQLTHATDTAVRELR